MFGDEVGREDVCRTTDLISQQRAVVTVNSGLLHVFGDEALAPAERGDDVDHRRGNDGAEDNDNDNDHRHRRSSPPDGDDEPPPPPPPPPPPLHASSSGGASAASSSSASYSSVLSGGGGGAKATTARRFRFRPRSRRALGVLAQRLAELVGVRFTEVRKPREITMRSR